MSKLTKFIFASDSHGDMADPEALAALYEFTKDFKPDIRVAGGDHYDFRSLRKGVGSDKEGAESLGEDIEAGEDFFAKWKPTVYLWGNHEYRLEAMQGHGQAIVRDYCTDIKDRINRTARKCGAKVILPYNAKKGVYRLGGSVAMVHGYAHGENATIKQGLHYASNGGGLIHGHTHNLACVSLTKHGGGAAFAAGCLCVDDMDYSSRNLASARHGNGFVAGFVTAGGDWKAWLVHKMGDQWIWQTELKTFKP